jgi:hypothetical protein
MVIAMGDGPEILYVDDICSAFPTVESSRFEIAVSKYLKPSRLCRFQNSLKGK